MHTTDWAPWTSYPDLSAERLAIVGEILRSARDRAAASQRPDAGETNWSLGCRAFECSCHDLTRAQEKYPWLRVEGAAGGPTHFIIRIGIVPIRFCANLPDRYKQVSELEAADLNEALELDPALPQDRFWRLTVDTDARGFSTAIRLVEFDRETHDTLNSYVVWSDSAVRVQETYTPRLVPFVPRQEQVTLPPPSITLDIPKADSAADE